MEIKHLNNKLYTELPIDELDERLSMEELQNKLEFGCWSLCNEYDPFCPEKYTPCQEKVGCPGQLS